MKSDEFYNVWKERRSRIRISEDFTSRVMDQIYQYEREKREPLFDGYRLIELISAHPFAKVGLTTVAVVTGLVRTMFAVCVFLGC